MVLSFAHCRERRFDTDDDEQKRAPESGAYACVLVPTRTKGPFCTSMTVIVGDARR